MFTDPSRIKRSDLGHPEICNVHNYYRVFAPARAEEVAQACRKAEIGCTECKKELAGILIAFLAPIQEKRNAFLKDKGRLSDILQQGRQKAAAVAEKTMAEVKGLINL
jgi:tryptophanyl-tRNA synthetase